MNQTVLKKEGQIHEKVVNIFTIKEIQMKSTLRFYCILIRMSITNNNNNKRNDNNGEGNRNPYMLLVTM
jgi:hypothetical protein